MHYEIQIFCSQRLWEFELRGSDLSSIALLSGFHIQPLTWCPEPSITCRKEAVTLHTRPTSTTALLCSWQGTRGWEKGGHKHHTAGQHSGDKARPASHTCHLQLEGLEPHLQNSPFLGTVTPHLPGHQSPAPRVFQSSLSRNRVKVRITKAITTIRKPLENLWRFYREAFIWSSPHRPRIGTGGN